MHQPQYRDALTGQYVLPWTYLHAIKDYTDMAAHLEAIPGARAVVNFTPVLIEQLEEIAQRVTDHLQSGSALPTQCWRCWAQTRYREIRRSGWNSCGPVCARSASR